MLSLWSSTWKSSGSPKLLCLSEIQVGCLRFLKFHCLRIWASLCLSSITSILSILYCSVCLIDAGSWTQIYLCLLIVYSSTPWDVCIHFLKLEVVGLLCCLSGWIRLVNFLVPGWMTMVISFRTYWKTIIKVQVPLGISSIFYCWGHQWTICTWFSSLLHSMITHKHL